MVNPIRWWREFRACVYWKLNIVFVLLAAVATGVGIRYAAMPLFLLLPEDSMAAEIVMSMIMMSKWHFASTAAVAALGGVTSFLHEVRTDPTNLRFINALGHMFAAQTAGLAMYLIALEYQWSVQLALLGCILAGWGGNKTIQKLNDMVLAKFGVDHGKGGGA